MSQELAVAVPGKETPLSIGRSEALRRAVNSKVMQVERSIVLNKMKRAKEMARQLEGQKEVVMARIKENQIQCKASEICVRSIDDVYKDTALWITKLHHERYKQYAALQVCQRRLELRELNPPELAQDSLQEALEIEQVTLNRARKDFQAQEVEVKQVVDDMAAVRVELSADAAHRRLAVTEDRAVLVNIAMAGAVAPGARACAAAGAEVDPETKECSLRNSRLLCQKSQQLEEIAAQVRGRSRAVIIRVRDECTQAVNRVEKRLTKRVEDTMTVTKQLIGQGKEVDYTIIAAERSLNANKKFIDKKDRNQGATFNAGENFLDQLKRSRRELSHDLRQKTILLNTSEACRKVTPQVAASPPPANLVKRPATSPAGTRARGNSLTQSTPALPSLTGPRDPDALAAALPDPSVLDMTLPEAEAEAQRPTSFEGGAENSQTEEVAPTASE